MSLVGSLEDLGLVDILQIVSLSRKSGKLMLRSQAGAGRILLRDGLVQGAAIKGEAEDLRGLLIAQGCVDSESFRRARQLADADAIDLDEALERACGLAADQLAALRRAHVERAVIRMFGWESGEFSFEITEDLPDEDLDLLLPSGLNTQYLAMEATRLGDEARRAAHTEDAGGADPDEDTLVLGEVASTAESAADSLAMATTRAVERATEEQPTGAVGDKTSSGAVAEVAVEAVPSTETRVPVAVTEPGPIRSNPTLVAIDADLSALEWLKASVNGLFGRTHIFQRRDAALVRIRQYLARGTVPLVVLADSPADRNGPDAEGFTSRLRALAPSMPILALRPDGASGPLPPDTDGELVRPCSPASDPDQWHRDEPIAKRLRRDLARWLPGEGAVRATALARGVL